MQFIKNASCFVPDGMLDSLTVEQFKSALELPWVVTGALMADAHAGYALPIGAVVAAKDRVVPSWVGYDIGCGVLALLTGWQKHQLVDGADCQQILLNIFNSVPVGFSHNEKPVKWITGNYIQNLRSSWLTDYTNQNVIENQIGTLGSGNHFIEIGYDQHSRVWIIIHSGSRNFGHTVATHYMKLASGDGKAREGHFALEKGSLAFSNYMTDQQYVLEFALENRLEIARRVFGSMEAVLGEGSAEWNDLINRNHNHVEYDKDFDVYIHRKGATHAEENMLGVIPGNMMDGSAIVMGLGCPDSLFSSSHGAGRCMSRKKAKEVIKMETLEKNMRGITCRLTEGILDEAPAAYKDFRQVLAMQMELIEVLHYITPIINVKGGK
jgi:tRNA-splicing ligase RtcB (3'-phosphate/5'-hydroxy nucleic acid ligase)